MNIEDVINKLHELKKMGVKEIDVDLGLDTYSSIESISNSESIAKIYLTDTPFY